MTDAPPIAPGPGETIDRGSVLSDRACNRCSYNLRGLAVEGACPECGAPVIDSLRGLLIAYASPEYVRDVLLGLRLIIWAAIIQAGVSVLGAAAGLVVALNVRTPSAIVLSSFIRQLVALAAALLWVWAYWLYTRLDPGYVGQESAVGARRLIRVAVVVSACSAVAQPIITLTGGPGLVTMPANAKPISVVVISVAVAVLSTAATVTHFFAAMLYTRWIASRVPADDLRNRAGTYMWVLPLVYVVGTACVGLGPIVATVMYLVLLHQLRQRIVAARGAAGAPA